MKKFIFTGILTLLTVFTFAQCPTGSKRNNGNPGECTAQITLLFDSAPSNYQIDSIIINGVKLASPVTFYSQGMQGTKFKAVYCFMDGNLPPAGGYQIFFKGDPLNPCYICVDCNPLPIKVTSFTARKLNATQIRVNITAEDSDGETIYIKLSYDGITWVTKGLFVPKGTESYSIIINK